MKQVMLAAVLHVAMNPNRVALASIVAFACMFAGSHAQARTFIDQAGRSLEGEVVKVEGAMVTIKRTSDGQMFTVPAATFSKADQAYIVGKGGTPAPAAPSAPVPSAPTKAPAPTPTPTPASTTKGQSVFSVDLLSPSKEYLFVDDTWKDGAECIQTKVSTTTDLSGKEVTLKAYFYSADGTLLDTLKGPSSRWDYAGNGSTTKSIPQFQKGKKYQVFFGIPEELKSGAKKWKRVIIVFGRNGDFDAKIYPKDDMKKFDFPEKSSVSAARLSQ